MKTAVVLATLVALALATPELVYKTKPIDQDLVLKQKQILSLFHFSGQVDTEFEYYKLSHDFDIEAHIDLYTNKKAVEEFLALYKTGFLPKNVPFSIFYERQRQEAVALFHLFFYAKDFETFYKTASFARIHMNEGQFLYAYYIALIHRADTKTLAIPAPYEVWPKLFTNSDVWQKVYRTKMQEGIFTPDFGLEQGVLYEDKNYIIYSNYSDYTTYPHDYKLSYFTEDIGLNAYYFYFHAYFPFWMDSQDYASLKERRGEIYYYTYQQLLARYYLERLANGMSEIQDFSWWEPIKAGYRPYMSYYHSFAQRPEETMIHNGKKSEELQLLDTYEKTFIQYLEKIHFKAYNQEIDMRNSKSVNFVGNFWQANADLHSKIMPNDNHNSYEVTARHILSAAPEPVSKYNFIPSALDFYQTSLRDPMFYQMYSKILKYFIEYKKYLTPYTQDMLHYVGVKINSVKVDKLVTYFDYYNFEVSNDVYFTKEEMKSDNHPSYVVRQPRLNHKPFTVNYDVKSDVDGDAVFKIFLGPKYDSKGYPISLEDNWQNFVELDWFVHKLVKGQNKVERSSTDFYFYKEDSAPVRVVNKMLTEGKLPMSMTPESFNGNFPKRLLLPRGSKGGFPFQLYVVVYPYEASTEKYEAIKNFEIDNKPFGYPLDRPVHEVYFKQPNMYFEDVEIYHEGEILPWKYNIPYNMHHYNDVTKH